jgi:hypothetical protein
MALRGTLHDFSLGDILQLIGFQRKTGVLSLEGSDDVVTISFLDGKVVSADSAKGRLDNRLGSLLVRAGKVEPMALAAAVDAGKQSGKRLGNVLIERGLISRDDLEEALRTQTLNLIYRLFRWQDGRYYFSQDSNVDYDQENFRPVPTENILMESARMIDEWPLIQKRVPSLGMVFRRAEGTESLNLVSELASAKPPGALVVSPVEALLWKLIDGRKSVTEITESTFLSDFDVAKALDQMVARHLVVEVSRPGEPTPPPAPLLAPVRRRLTGASIGLWIAVIALLAISLYVMPRNPVNVGFRMNQPGGILDRLRHAISVARLQRVDRGVELFYLSQGQYPDKLTELTSASILEGFELPQGNFGKYLYILRKADGKYDLYGKYASGTVDPNLVLGRALDPVTEEGRSRGARRREKAVPKPEKIDVVN